MPTPPRVLGDYLLSEHSLGAGAFGEVFIGMNRHDGRYCAVKTVTPYVAVAEIDGIRALVQEIDGDNHLLPILHVGRLPDRAYFVVMPLADDSRGRLLKPPPRDYVPMTLAKYIRDKAPLPFADLTKILDRLIIAVKRLHNAGLVHCDIKPTNIMRLDGEWKLGDFSIASRRNTNAGGPGDPWYRPPEGSGDFPADVYALGKTLFQMATGAVPPTGPTEPDSFLEFAKGKMPLGYREDRTSALNRLITASTRPAPRERIFLHELHEEVSALVQKTRVIVNISGEVDLITLEQCFKAAGVCVKSTDMVVLQQ